MHIAGLSIHRSTAAFVVGGANVNRLQGLTRLCPAEYSRRALPQYSIARAISLRCSAVSATSESQMVRDAPYGEWESAITSAALTAATVSLSDLFITHSAIYWLEGRPQDQGRTALVCSQLSEPSSIKEVVSTSATKPGDGSWFNVRTRVHEYGGRAYVVDEHSRKCYFSNFADQRVYAVDMREGADAQPVPITEEGSKQRFADYHYDANRNRLFCVRETHFADREAVNEIVAINADTGQIDVLASGHDFYASPRLDSSGSRLAFQAWDHPSMPWDSTGIYLGDVSESNGSITFSNVICVTGGQPYGHSESVSAMEPTFSPTGDLFYISDKNGWWSIYRYRDSSEAELVFGKDGIEIGGPQWLFGAQSYQFLPGSSGMKMLVAYSDVLAAGTQLAIVDLQSATWKTLSAPLTCIRSFRIAPRQGHGGVVTIACIGGSSKIVSRVTLLSLDLEEMDFVPEPRDVKLSSPQSVQEEYLSEPQVIEFPTTNGKTAFMMFYRPKNDYFECQDKSIRPPLLVKSHGGPTSSASTMYNPLIQYFTSRGFAVADINYGGSSGYGKEFRNRLKEQWGIVDVDDCANAALYLAKIGLVDRSRLAISGGSAGGFTTLACLAFRNDVFGAGASYYGVADLNLLAAETHKFESRYVDSMVGPLPDAKKLYDERSPINSVDKLRCPLVQFQGLEDKIVPPSQARRFYDALRASGIPTALVEFPGEQHGFRGTAAIRRALDGEMWFYGHVFHFEPRLGADDFVPLTID